MAVTTYGVNDALAVKLWSKKLAVEVSKATAIAPLIGTSSNSIIQLKDETSKGSGDKVTFGLRTQLVGDGVSHDELGPTAARALDAGRRQGRDRG